MLIEVLDELAQDIIPDVFADSGTEFVDVVRVTDAANDYGGIEPGTPGNEYSEIPCVLTMRATSNSTRWQLGEEYLDARIQMPSHHLGEVITLFMTDKLKIAERDGANPERTYEIKDIQNMYGVYYDVGVVTES